MVKKKGMRLSFCKGDMLVIFFVTMLAVLIGVVFLIWTGRDRGNTVVVYREGKKVQELPLYVDGEILIENSYTNKLVV